MKYLYNHIGFWLGFAMQLVTFLARVLHLLNLASMHKYMLFRTNIREGIFFFFFFFFYIWNYLFEIKESLLIMTEKYKH